jgi:hypothetical protein
VVPCCCTPAAWEQLGRRYRDGSEGGLEGGGHAHARISTPAVRRGSVALADLHVMLRCIECAHVTRLPSAFAASVFEGSVRLQPLCMHS